MDILSSLWSPKDLSQGLATRQQKTSHWVTFPPSMYPYKTPRMTTSGSGNQDFNQEVTWNNYATILDLAGRGRGSESIDMTDSSQGIGHLEEGAELCLWREGSSPPKALGTKTRAPAVVTKAGTGGQGVGTLGGSHLRVVTAGSVAQVQAEASLMLDTVSQQRDEGPWRRAKTRHDHQEETQ